jgi:hypothetical protein
VGVIEWSQNFSNRHLIGISHLTPDLVGGRLADAALQLPLGRRAVEHADVQAGGEPALFVGRFFGLPPIRGEEFTDVFKEWVLVGFLIDSPVRSERLPCRSQCTSISIYANHHRVCRKGWRVSMQFSGSSQPHSRLACTKARGLSSLATALGSDEANTPHTRKKMPR